MIIMKRHVVSVFAAAVVFHLAIGMAQAQEEQQRTLWRLNKYVIKASMEEQFVNAVKELREIDRKYHNPRSTFASNNSSGYSFAIPEKNIGPDTEESQMWREYTQKTWEAEEDRLHDIFTRMYSAIQSRSVELWQHNPGLSYTPENPRLDEGEAGIIHIRAFFVKQGHGRQFREIVSDYIELCRENNIPNGFNCYTLFAGEDMPQFVFVSEWKNSEDYTEQQSLTKDHLGEEGLNLFLQALNICDKYAQEERTIQRQLSYISEEQNPSSKENTEHAHHDLHEKLNGTWRLSQSRSSENGSLQNVPDVIQYMKVFDDGFFVVINNNDGMVETTHGGTYTINGDKITEKILFGDEDRNNIVGSEFSFILQVDGDSLVQKGIKGSGGLEDLEEHWKRR